MKPIVIFPLFSIAFASLSSTFDVEIPGSNILKAFEQVVSTQVNNSIRIIGRREYFRDISDWINSTDCVLELLTLDSFNAAKFKIKSSYVNVIFYKNASEALGVFTKENLKYFRLDGFYILLGFAYCNETEEERIFATVWKQQIFNINIICSNKSGKILMKTFIPYQRQSCGSTETRTVSKFINNSWTNIDFFPEKLNKMYGCPLKVVSFYYPPIVMRQTFKNGTHRYYGSEMEILHLMSYAINFSVNHTYYNYFSKGITLENGTFTGTLKMVKDCEQDMAMGFQFLNFPRAKWLSFSQSHYGVSTVIIIPPGRLFNSFEKLSRPFRFNVWICLMIMLSFAVLTIWIVNFQCKSVKACVFGTGINTPMLNLLSILFTGIINKLPRQTFARYILIMFMFFCFIFRSLYQGALYQFLQSNNRKPDVATIDEMMKRDFVFYVRDTLEYSVKHMSIYNRTIVVKPADYPFIIPKTLDSSYKGGIIIPVIEVIYSNYINKKNFTLRVLKEYLLDVPIVFYFPKNFHLMNVINTKMGILQASGLVSMWMDLHLDKKYVKFHSVKRGPKVMSLQDLKVGFDLLIIGVGFSLAAFILEKLSTTKLIRYLNPLIDKS